MVLAALPIAPRAQEQASGEQRWRFELMPYLWAASLTGDTAAGGSGSPIDPGYSLFELENLQAAFMLSGRASRGPWSIQLDGMYVDFEDSFRLGPISTTLRVDGGFVELAAARWIGDSAAWQWLAGARNVSLRTSITLDPGPDGTGRRSWLDPFLGLRYERALGTRWSVLARGDIGGFDAGSHLTYNLLAAAQYALSPTFVLRAGYRILQLDFRQDDYLMNLRASGFGLGLGIRF